MVGDLQIQVLASTLILFLLFNFHYFMILIIFRGNMGGGATAIVMPAIAAGIAHSGVYMFTAWRWAFFVPGGIFLIMGAISMAFGVVSE